MVAPTSKEIDTVDIMHPRSAEAIDKRPSAEEAHKQQTNKQKEANRNNTRSQLATPYT
jgi:hypothetical protein